MIEFLVIWGLVCFALGRVFGHYQAVFRLVRGSRKSMIKTARGGR